MKKYAYFYLKFGLKRISIFYRNYKKFIVRKGLNVKLTNITAISLIIFSIISGFLTPKAGATTFTTSGTWTVPAGTSSAIMETWGGGAAGQCVTSNFKEGGGGGGGGYAKKTIAVSVGQVYTVTVGAGGVYTISGGVCSVTTAAGDSSVTSPSSTTVVLAKAGTNNATPINGGLGGSSASEIGDVVYSGGNGGNGVTGTSSGGGGGGAGSTGVGGNGSGTTAGTGTSTNGGNGGAGRTSRGAGNAGSIYGGGGGGGFTTSNTGQNGGAGGQGLVIITPVANSAPSTPTLSTPSSGATNVSTAPSFTLSSTDSDSDYIEYRIYLYQSDCSTAVGSSPFAETSSQTGWSGQDANSGGAYSSGTTATYTYQGTLSANTTYCWKADAIDPGGTNTYGTVSSTRLFTTSSVVKLRQEINILDGTLAVSSTSGSIIQLDTDKYDGSASYYFEVVTGSSSASTDSVTLTRKGTTTNDATISLAGTAANTRVRSASFTPPTGTTEYVVKTGANHTIKAARIIVIQTTGPLYKTESQIDIGDQENLVNTTAAPLTNPKYWNYTSSNWDGDLYASAEVVKAQSGTNFSTTITLQKDNGAFGSWTNVGNIVNADTTSAAARFRVFFTLTANVNYRIVASESSATSGKNYTIYSAKIIIDQIAGTWSTVGSTLSTLPIASGAASADLSSTRIATLVSNSLSAYDFNGSTWSLTGSALTISGSLNNGIAAMSSTRVAVYFYGTGQLITYDFNGSTWSQTGSAATITGASVLGSLADLSTTRIAFENLSTHTLQAYDFNGSTWSSVGSGLSLGFTGGESMTGLSSSRVALSEGAGDTLRSYDFNGSTWSQTGNSINISSGGCPLTTLTSGSIAYFDQSLNTIDSYSFDGTNWSFTAGSSALFGSSNNYPVTALSSTRLSLIKYDGLSSSTLQAYDFTKSALTKSESQYLLQNTVGSTSGLQGFPSKWDSTEWSGVSNTYKNVIDSTNALSSTKLQDISNANSDLYNSTVTGNNQTASSAMYTPPTGDDFDTNITANPTTVTADRVIAYITFGNNTSPAAPTLITPSSGATGVSVTPSFTLRTSDTESDYLKYRIYLYQSDCSTSVGTFDMSGAGWTGQDINGGTSYLGSSTLSTSTIATYTYQGTLSGSTTYCWKADAVDPGGSNTYGSASSTQSFTTASASGPTTDQEMRGGVYFNNGIKQPLYWAQ